jgi:flagellar motor switch protein FliM
MAAEEGASEPIKLPIDMMPFNFSRAGMVAPDQMRTLRTLDEQFARNLTHTLGAWLRTTITVIPMPPEEGIYSQFAEATATGCHILPLTVEPLQARAVLSSALALAPAIIDLLLGGSGRSSAMERELTEIEEAVLRSVLDIVLREWTMAWQPFGIEFFVRAREAGGHGQRPMPLQERTYCSRFQVNLAETTGDLLFCMPSATIASALRVFAHRRERQRQRGPEERSRMVHRLGGARVNATLHFPGMQLRAEELHSMTAGTLLPLPLSCGVEAELRVGGTPLFRARPVRAGEHRAAQIVHPLQDAAAGGKA